MTSVQTAAIPSQPNSSDDILRPHSIGHRWHWANIWSMVIMHGTAMLAVLPIFFHWSGLVVMIVSFYLVGGIGVCLGYHRLLTHKSFQTTRFMNRALCTLGTMSMQGGPLQWIGTHRIHHSDSDGPHDPHSPEHGFTWSHILWCFYRHTDGHDPLDFTKDLQRDPYIAWLDTWFFVPQLILSAILFCLGWLALGSWTGGACWVVWGVAVRTVVLYHVTWFVNSAAHTWGYRNFTTTDGSRNNWWVALLSFGEGWHNNHHAQQRSAAHGMKWWEIDMTWWAIVVLEKIGLAKKVVRPKVDEMDGA